MPRKRRLSSTKTPKITKPGVRALVASPGMRELFPEIIDGKKLVFLEAYIRAGTKAEAYRRTKVAEVLEWSWRFRDAAYTAALEMAGTLIADHFEEALRDRVLHGTEREVWFLGAKVGIEHRHSDRLLLKALESWKPERYGRRQTLAHELTPAMQTLVDTWEPVTPSLAVSTTDARPPWQDEEEDADAEFEDEAREEAEDEGQEEET